MPKARLDSQLGLLCYPLPLPICRVFPLASSAGVPPHLGHSRQRQLLLNPLGPRNLHRDCWTLHETSMASLIAPSLNRPSRLTLRPQLVCAAAFHELMTDWN